jgi:ribose/xylose/arabinose/galactoside ABC-type transport system permease subunit
VNSQNWTVPLRKALAGRALQITLVVVVLGVALTSLAPIFASEANLRNIALDSSLLLVLAAGVAVVVVTRNLDLSVGSAVGVTAMGTATAVHFGAVDATAYANLSATQVVATAPAGSGTVHVTVTTAGGVSPTSVADYFEYSSGLFTVA